ncbi:MAG TPA: GNAT family N-acetyltransferase [Alphaproteobacteria bacterium]|nr:GNAT family N-acetyltransferase [Alphaproteobacteria bacterium]HBF99830.1 GNAT family N-acetyltransferase [Alphaproteobacteria bacterium]HCO89408.1 GNAT family N-acetyltransferase [Alphaproteobacteria bacterium]
MSAIRPAAHADIPALAAIYNHYIRETPATFDIAEKDLDDRTAWFEGFSLTGPYRLFVADAAGEVLGYAYSGRFKERAAYASSIETSIYLRPDATGKGVGSALYTALFAALAQQDVHRAYAGITLPNAASEAIHRRFGFHRIGIYGEVGRKFGKYWDVAWYERAL